MHFEATNLAAIEAVRDGEIGEPRTFHSVFTMPVLQGNTRLSGTLGGGPLYDIGVYCINAARNLFGAEPIEVVAMADKPPSDERFSEVDEQLAAVLRFPSGKLASFACSFGAASVARCEIIGTEGHVRLDPAYHHDGTLELFVQTGEHTKHRKLKARDQVAPEINHFSDCILQKRVPEPSGAEGLADVRIIRAILESAASGRAVKIEPVERVRQPSVLQAETVRPHREVDLVHAKAPTR